MHATATIPQRKPVHRTGYAGLRLTAEEYFALPDDGNKYELVDGVLLMSPSATTGHQRVAAVLFGELYAHVEPKRLGLLLFETDVNLGKSLGGAPIVYRPEIVFISMPRAAQVKRRIEIVPDLVIEIISPDSRSLDSETKFCDYERAGVKEYWLIDPLEERMTFYRLVNGRFVEVPTADDVFISEAVPGFRLNLSKVRAVFREA